MFLHQVSWDIDTYGLSVCAAFGEYCGHRQRLLAHRPRLAHDPMVLSHMVQLLMSAIIVRG